MMAAILQPSLSGNRPRTSPELVKAVCFDAWGIEGRFERLPAVADEVFRLETADGQRYVLKLTSPFEDSSATDFQTQALSHLGKTDAALPIPRLIPTRSGDLIFRPDWPNKPPPTARLFTWLDGVTVAQAGRPDGGALGTACARLSIALAGFDHPGADQDHDWDLRRAARLVPLIDEISDIDNRHLAQRAMNHFLDFTASRLEHMRRQVVHNDFNLHNVLVDPEDSARITGIIDFGDMVRTALIADVAIAVSYLLDEGDDPLATITPFIMAYHRQLPLLDEEIMLMPALMQGRHLMTAAITEWRAQRNPADHAAITKNTARAWRGLRLLDRLSHDALADALLSARNAAGGAND